MPSGPHVVIFDLETRLSPDDPRVGGWEALREGRGGISALAIFDSREEWCYLYDDHCLHEAAAHLESADVIVGFRSAGFDRPCLEGLLDRRLKLREHVDLLELAWEAIGQRDSHERMRGYKLKEIALRCLGRSKLEQGAHAPVLAAEGQWARLFRYCMDDVRLTRDLLHYIQQHGGIIDANGGFLQLRLPACLTPSS